jgi:mediator of replication checkpoint protein 1
MRKALLEDENIGKIAENPKKSAFLRALEDRDEDDDIDFLDGEIQVDSVPDSQNAQGSEAPEAQNVSPVIQPSDQAHQQHAGPTTAGHKTSRLSHRRLGIEVSMTRPTTMTEIRESVSFLVDEPLVPDSQRSDSEDEDDDAMDVDATIATSRQEGSREVLRMSVVNRLSTVSTEKEDHDGPMAFHAPTSTSTSSFKVPSLLRRATNLSSTSNSSSGASTPTTECNVRMGGSKKSNIHYQAREAERRKIVEAADRKRKEEVKKSVLGKGRRSMLGVLGSHSSGFE